MDVTSIIAALNPPQRDAVCAVERSALVLAGAGSGKTRVLVHRLAWLMQAEGVPAQSLLAVTFTNKAAREMRSRVESLLGVSTQPLWIGTFHGLTHRLLRKHSKAAGLPATFQIIDTDDQLRLVKRLARDMNLDETRWPPRQLQWLINQHKEAGQRAHMLKEPRDALEALARSFYREYERLCQQAGLVDFAELLLRSLELFQENKDLLDFYQSSFHYVLVDEFQDTNRIQYDWLKLLTQKKQNLFAVGDDDQSIYSWRGAQVENLQRFQTDYPGHRLVRLEQNYRSTGTILAAANALISHNQDRLGKALWTEDGEGDRIALYTAFNETDEALFVTRRIQASHESGRSFSDCAILYRSNAQSRQFEEKLVALGIPYRVYGGLRFFERQEIRDALAYLRLVQNSEDDASFERVINTPPRGIGPRTLERLRDLARQDQVSLWKATEALALDPSTPARTRNPLTAFLEAFSALRISSTNQSLSLQTERCIVDSGLMAHYQKERTEEAQQRIENLEELMNATRQFEREVSDDPDLSPIDQFLAHAALEAGERSSDGSSDAVQLMTLHASKGLEFGLVFLVGLEEGLFPSLQSMEHPGRLEEERRLCYVGITRARQSLVLTHAESRRLYGRENRPPPSRFLREIPRTLMESVRLGASPLLGQPHREAPSQAPTRLRIGQEVEHPKFGVGIILNAEGEGPQARVEVRFAAAGNKWLMVEKAVLTPTEN